MSMKNNCLKNFNLTILLLIILTGSQCTSECRLYKRVGGPPLLLVSGTKALLWFNGIHGHHPKNPMFEDIAQTFREFEPDFVLVERNAERNIPDSRLSAIREGESKFVAYLSQAQQIPMGGTEPTDAAIFHNLETLYTKEELLATYIIRQMVQWNREAVDTSFESNLLKFSNHVNQALQYSTAPLTLDQLSEILEPYSGIHAINNANYTAFDAKTYLYFSDNLIHTIYKDIIAFRNIYVVQTIQQKLKEYNKIYIMMGFDHAIEVKPQLQMIFDTL